MSRHQYNAVYAILPLQRAVSPECQPVRLCSTNTFCECYRLHLLNLFMSRSVFQQQGETWIWHWRLCGFHASPGFARRKTDVRPRGPWPHCLLLKVAVVDEAAVFSKTWDVKQTLDFLCLLRFCLQVNLYSFLPFWTMTSFCISLQRFAWIWFFKLTMPTWSTDLSIHGSISGKPTVQPWVCVQVCFTSLPGRTPERTTEWVSSVLPPRSWQMPAMLYWEENIPASAFAGRTLHGEYIK